MWVERRERCIQQAILETPAQNKVRATSHRQRLLHDTRLQMSEPDQYNHKNPLSELI